MQEECGLDVTMVDGAFSGHRHLGQRLETSAPLLVVQMLTGPYVSALLIYAGKANGRPAAQGDGARDAQFVNIASLKHLLEACADDFTALSFAALTTVAARDLL